MTVCERITHTHTHIRSLSHTHLTHKHTFPDLQNLINAFVNFCDKSHQQVAVDKIEAMISHKCDCGDHECKFMRDGKPCERTFKHVFEENDKLVVVVVVEVSKILSLSTSSK